MLHSLYYVLLKLLATRFEYIDSPRIFYFVRKTSLHAIAPFVSFDSSVPLACPPFAPEVLHYDPLWSRALLGEPTKGPT